MVARERHLGLERRGVVMLHPRAVLLLLAAMMALVGWQTAEYPPAYLALSAVWSALSLATAMACVVACAHRHRGWMVIAGAGLACTAAGRAVTIAAHIALDAMEGPQRQTYTIAAVTWSMVLVLVLVVWAGVMVPWSATRRSAGDTTRRT